MQDYVNLGKSRRKKLRNTTRISTFINFNDSLDIMSRIFVVKVKENQTLNKYMDHYLNQHINN